jgi:hypothetical protein
MKTALVLALLMSASVSGSAWGQSVDEIVAKNLAARGGIEKMRAIRTMVVTAKLETPGGSGPLIVRLARPDRILEDLTLNGVRTIRGFDGKAAWVDT